MILRIPGLALLGVIAASSGCSSEEIYNSSSEWRAQECGKLEPREQEQCRQEARTPYSQVRKARGEAGQ
ncbi:hypothetical protein D0B54_06465 [Solimonas sp. K1W22B-7]|uniref:hypothetical protein n=1 Tax=Solimonas sp. K1W22B-7 TaxID=2303331 RepID=UPI000E333066|nr:hypothetical protein [Solimonas sp. K1W22B-7]AXQ28345.1 hypothetical protein D0B54_06465 [Solimonas sp. K1W22B-7]